MLNSLKTTFKEVTKEVFKEAGKKVRRELDNWTTFKPSMSEDVSDCLEDHRGQPMKKLADLRLVVRQCMALSSDFDELGAGIDSYVVVQVEGATRSTAVMYREADPVFNTAMNFSVRNLTGDVILQVYSSSEGVQGFGNRCIGQAFIPISSLLPRLEPESVGAVQVGSVPVGAEGAPVPTRMRTTVELELYPLPKDATKFQQVPLEMRGDVKGLARPARALGRIEVECELALLEPLLDVYLSASSPGVLSKRAALRLSSGKDADEDDIDFNVLRWNALRIRDALCVAPRWWCLVSHLRSWRQPWLSAAALLLVSGIALTAQLWQTPLLLAGSALALGKFSGAARRRERGEGASPWQEELTTRRDKTLVARALSGKALVLRVQRETGRVAATLERVRNALNWSDSNVSMVLGAALTAACALVSVLCLLLEILWPILPVRQLLMLAAVALFLPPPVRHTIEEYNLKVFGRLVADVRLGVGLSTSISPDQTERPDDTDYVTIGPRDAASPEQNERDLGAVGHTILALSRLWASVPDELEMTHRTIARQQVRGVVQEAVRSEGEQHAAATGETVAGTDQATASVPAVAEEEAGSPAASEGVRSRPLVLRKEGGDAAAEREEAGARLEREVMEEVGAVEVEAWTEEREAEMEEAEVQAALAMSVADIRAALRECGSDGSGLIEKREMARELARLRVQRTRNYQAPKPQGGVAESGAERRSQLALLAEMGFTDEAENAELLQRFDGDVDQVVKHVLKR